MASGEPSDSSTNTSAVFFDESSFNSVVQTEYIVSTSSGALLDDNIYEGCSGASLTIIRPDNNIGDLNILYHLYGEAEYLVDFTLANGSLYSRENKSTNLSSQSSIVRPATSTFPRTGNSTNPFALTR